MGWQYSISYRKTLRKLIQINRGVLLVTLISTNWRQTLLAMNDIGHFQNSIWINWCRSIILTRFFTVNIQPNTTKDYSDIQFEWCFYVRPSACVLADNLSWLRQLIFSVRCSKKAFKLFYSWGREAVDNASFSDTVDLLSQEFPPLTDSSVLLGSLDRLDYVPPVAAAPAPTDVGFIAGPPENAGWVHTLLSCVRQYTEDLQKRNHKEWPQNFLRQKLRNLQCFSKIIFIHQRDFHQDWSNRFRVAMTLASK